jgi:hypothetical protein
MTGFAFGLLLLVAKLAVLRMLSRLPPSACTEPTGKAA